MSVENNYTTNSSCTYIRYALGNSYYGITSAVDQCNHCIKIFESAAEEKSKIVLDGSELEPKEIIICGPVSSYDSWKKVCKTHLSEVCVKQQLCNLCNKKSTIKTEPKICEKCAVGIIDRTTEMNAICLFPTVDQSDCMCKYCKLRLGIKV